MTQCALNLKNTAKHLFHAIRALEKNHHRCHHKHSHMCTSNILDIAASFSGFGAFVAGTVGQCKRTTDNDADNRKSLCAQASAALLEIALKVSKDGVDLDHYCKPHHAPAPAPHAGPAGVVVIEREEDRGYQADAQGDGPLRLFELDGKADGNTSMMNFVLGAFLPVTAIVSFVGGRAWANRRSRIQQTREFMSDEE